MKEEVVDIECFTPDVCCTVAGKITEMFVEI